MRFNWYKYFELAEKLLMNEDEASYRSSISRAYYSLFNYLCGLVSDLPRRDKHQELITFLKEKEDEWNGRLANDFAGVSDDDIRFIGDELKYLRNMRNKSDYDALPNITKVEAEEVYQKVKGIFEIIEEAQEE
jgi:uncharacterized protein (UPF0332 family)